MKSLRDEFARDCPSNISGCYFHWKQAIRRKLIELKVSREYITALVGQGGLIEMLTMLPYDDIDRGIAYIRAHLDEGSRLDPLYYYHSKI